MDAITNWNAIQCTTIKRGWNAISDVCFNTRIDAYHILYTAVLHFAQRQYMSFAVNLLTR